MGIFDRPGLRYISHRGFRPLAPDNSLPGFEYAGILNQWAIETDVHMTKDGHLVCCHNTTVEETYDGSGLISELSWHEISKMRMDSGSRLECFTDEQKRMPLFSEYLAICRKYGSVPFVELKTDDVLPVIQAIHKAGFQDDEVVISTTSLDRLIETRKYSKELFIHWIFAKEEQIETLTRLGNAGLSWNISNSFECPMSKIEHPHKLGLKVCLRAADRVETVNHMLSLGVDYLPTNCMHEILQGVNI